MRPGEIKQHAQPHLVKSQTRMVEYVWIQSPCGQEGTVIKLNLWVQEKAHL